MGLHGMYDNHRNLTPATWKQKWYVKFFDLTFQKEDCYEYGNQNEAIEQARDMFECAEYLNIQNPEHSS